MAYKIKVHEKALAHLSRGLYRSPASAIRELISNAWDANATIVRVNTNYPTFYQISVSDNGDGFTKNEFKKIMSGGVGNSVKRTEGYSLRFDRPMIGRLGIGMLGIAQICGSFLVISKPKKGEGFRARVNLYDLAKEKMDVPDSELVHDTKLELDSDEESEGSVKVVDVGEFEFEQFEPEKEKPGTRILADIIHPQFTQAFQKSLDMDGYKSVPKQWENAVRKILNKTITLQYLGDYWRLIWELAASCPLRYFSRDSVPSHMITDRQQSLERYKFRVIVDGRELFKPVLLKGHKGGYTCRKVGPVTKRIYGRTLSFAGYLAVQEGKQLRPDELRGIMIRVKNIGIGYYDPSLLDYRVNQGPRSRWLTGEIFVDEGLEDAMNIDRDSFNKFHPQFRALQEEVHTILEKQIFPQVYKNIDVRSEEKERGRERKRRVVLSKVVKDNTDRRLKLVKQSEDLRKTKKQKALFRETRKKIEVVVPTNDDLGISKRYQQLAQSIFAIFEIALHETGRQAQRKKFSELLLELFRRW